MNNFQKSQSIKILGTYTPEVIGSYYDDILDFIEKSDYSEEEVRIVLFQEFRKLILQGKITFMFTYCDSVENRLRGRVGSSSGFRHGTQRLSLIPNNRWPKKRSKNQTALRYYDFGRYDWRSLRKDLFVVATSFFDERDKKWKTNPLEAGFTTNWKDIVGLNRLKDYKKVYRQDTREEETMRELIKRREAAKRLRQIEKTLKKKS